MFNGSASYLSKTLKFKVKCFIGCVVVLVSFLWGKI